MEEINGMLTAEEILVAEKCLEKSLALGADKVRITLNKSLMELFGTLNGELDKVSHCLDRSISVCLFVDGKFGSFSTNRLVESELDDFLKKGDRNGQDACGRPLQRLAGSVQNGEKRRDRQGTRTL